MTKYLAYLLLIVFTHCITAPPALSASSAHARPTHNHLNASRQLFSPTGQEDKANDYYAVSDGSSFIIYADKGKALCRDASLAETHDMDRRNYSLRLRQITHKNLERDYMGAEQNADDNYWSPVQTTSNNEASAGMKIVLRATDQLKSFPEAEAAFIKAAQTWESIISSQITVIIDVDYGPKRFGEDWPSKNVLGQTRSQLLSRANNYDDVRGRLIAKASNPEEQTLYSSLPTGSVPTELGSVSQIVVSSPILRALEFPGVRAVADPSVETNFGPLPAIAFNSAHGFDFNPEDGITSGKFDFNAVAVHEIGHALGFTSMSGSKELNPEQPLLMSVWDLFRFRPGVSMSNFTTANRVLSSGGDHVHFQNAPQLGLSTGKPDGTGGDGRQASHWKDDALNGGNFIGIMDPNIPAGRRETVTINDRKAVDAFGFLIGPPPPPPANDNFTSSTSITGTAGTARGNNTHATRETGEQNHSPDAKGGSKSVWYKWTAPSSGPATIDTVNSDFDTVLSVYSGTALNNLVRIQSNDDIDPGLVQQSRVSFNASANTTYYIAVDGWNGDFGRISLNWTINESVTLSSNQTEIRTWTTGGRTYAYVKYIFPNASYRITRYTQFPPVPPSFSVDVQVERSIGPALQVETNSAQIFDLGPLAPGTYTFNLRTSSTTIRSQQFTVSATAPPPNQIDDAREFARRHYNDFLNREPDIPGWNHWTGEITQCSDPARRLAGETEAQCVDRKRVNTSGAFFLSTEFQNTGYFVVRVYRGTLGRMPKLSEWQPDTQTVSQGIVVNNALSADRINANKRDFANNFVNRPEFKALYPDSMTPAQFVDTMFETTGVTPTTGDRQALINELSGPNPLAARGSVVFKIVDGTLTRPDATLEFQTAYGKEFYDDQFNAAFVLMQYFGYLRRDPDESGYGFWLNKLDTFGNFTDAQMVRAFIVSSEYRSRFGQP